MNLVQENYIEALAREIESLIDPAKLPTEGDTNALFRSYAVLALALGAQITAQDVHDAWVAWMLDIDPSHPALIPYDQLDRKTAAEDAIFVAAIQAAVQRLTLPPRSRRTS